MYKFFKVKSNSFNKVNLLVIIGMWDKNTWLCLMFEIVQIKLTAHVQLVFYPPSSVFFSAGALQWLCCSKNCIHSWIWNLACWWGSKRIIFTSWFAQAWYVMKICNWTLKRLIWTLKKTLVWIWVMCFMDTLLTATRFPTYKYNFCF